jgi:hypothetical protein
MEIVKFFGGVTPCVDTVNFFILLTDKVVT